MLDKESATAGDDGRFLFSECERCIEVLGKLVQIHLTMDDPGRTETDAAPEPVLRLRKVLLHVRAVISWNLGEYALHVMAPEIRVALEQLSPPLLNNARVVGSRGDDKAILMRKDFANWARDWDKRLAQFSHPNRITLAFHEQFGGLAKDDSLGYWCQLAWLLSGLTGHYGLSLCEVASYLDPSKEPEILDLVNQSWATPPESGRQGGGEGDAQP